MSHILGVGPDSDISCEGDFPPKPDMGSYKWNGVRGYDAEVEYTCGPYGTFVWPNGTRGSSVRSRCLWNRTWSRVDMPECKCKFFTGWPDRILYQNQTISDPVCFITDTSNVRLVCPLEFPYMVHATSLI